MQANATNIGAFVMTLIGLTMAGGGAYVFFVNFEKISKGEKAIMLFLAGISMILLAIIVK